MTVYFMQGKLGSGKSLGAISKIREKIKQGLPVATNFDLYMDKHPNPKLKFTPKNTVFRIPDKPDIVHFDMLGYGNRSYDEKKNGLLVLDELGTWFNSRSWSDKSRKAIIDWLLHARKYGWDIIFVVQDISIVDKQARETLCENLVNCRNMANWPIPVLSFLWKLIFSKPLYFPKFHIGTVYAGDNLQAYKLDRWWYKGEQFYDFYDTKQIFTQTEDGLSCYLSPWHLKGRYQVKKNFKYYLDKLNHAPAFAMLFLMLLIIIQSSTQAHFYLEQKKTNEVLQTTGDAVVNLISTMTDISEKTFVIHEPIEDNNLIPDPFNTLCSPHKTFYLSGNFISDNKITYKTKSGYSFSSENYSFIEESNQVKVFEKECYFTLQRFEPSVVTL